MKRINGFSKIGIYAIDTVLAGILAFSAVDLLTNRGLERVVDETEVVEEDREDKEDEREITRLKELDKKYSFLDVYDSVIDSCNTYFRKRLGLEDLTINSTKAQIFIESGSQKHRESAFRYDPMQIANQGDFALKVLANGNENTELIGDFSGLRGKTSTPRKNGKWDYSDTNMSAQDSIFGGIGWRIHYRAEVKWKTFEEGDFQEYEIQKGDCFYDLQKELGTTVDVLEKYNPEVNPRKLRQGDKIRYRKAERKKYVAGFKDFSHGIRRYNGGGDPDYIEKYETVLGELNERDSLKQKHGKI
jgi:hypothetical protein